MKTMKVFAGAAAGLLIAAFLMSFVLIQQKPKAWDVPANYKSMKNPAKADLAGGKALWGQHCAPCHGKAGLGDGPKGRNLESSPGDFTSAAFQGQTDGEIFFKVKTGRGEMPKYDKKIQDEDMWNLVHYMRSFKK